MFDLATAPDPSGPFIDPHDASPSRRARSHAAQRRRLQRSLSDAVAGGDMLLRYRPRVALDSGRQTAAEAVVRWRDRQAPHGGALGRMVDHVGGSEVGGWMLRAACAEAASWQAPCAVSVQVCAPQLSGGTLLEQVAAALDQSGLDPELLEVTLTESALVDLSVNTLLLLSAIRDLGAGVALDRFGTGLVSLAVLHRLPLTAVKLDQSLLRSLAGDGQDAALARTVIAAGHALDLVVVADGVCNADQMALLRDSGCDEGQGAAFGAAISSERVSAGRA